jgi:transcriptional regulator with XRE-family HTH domain
MARSVKPRYLDGEALRLARANAGLEQAGLAEKVGVNQGQVSDWERGYNGCRLGMLHKLAEALGCEPSALMLKPADSGNENGAAA